MPRTEKSNSIAVQGLSAADKSDVDLAVERALAERARKGKDPFANIEAKVEYSGKVITLPDDPAEMSLATAQVWLARLEQADAQEVSVHEMIESFPLDGAVAFSKALKALFGFANPEITKARSFFERDEPPTMVSVQTDVDEHMTVFWGAFSVPGVRGTLQTSITKNEDGRHVFLLSGKVTRGSLKIVHKLAELTRRFVQEDSIYRGKALELRMTSNGHVAWSTPPKFIDLRGVKAEELVFSEDVQTQITTNLYAPVEHSAVCRQVGIPLKRTVLVEGPFGTGKTLCANVTAQKAIANGWTFITVGRASALRDALQVASLYQPCVVFVEDIDREVQGARSAEMDDVLNTIDGVLSKGKEILVVLTSNEAEKINRAMLRPGRIDAVIHIGPPDAKAAEKLMRLYGRGLIDDQTDLAMSSKDLAGEIPATIREAVERAKLHAIARKGSADIHLLDVDISSAAWGMKRHLELLRGREVKPKTPSEVLGDSLIEVFQHSLANGGADGFGAKIEDLARKVEQIHDATV